MKHKDVAGSKKLHLQGKSKFVSLSLISPLMSRLWLNIKFYLGIALFGGLFIYLCYWGYTYARNYVLNYETPSGNVEANSEEDDIEEPYTEEELAILRELIEEEKLKILRAKDEFVLQNRREAAEEEPVVEDVDFTDGEIVPEPVLDDEEDKEEGDSDSEGETAEDEQDVVPSPDSDTGQEDDNTPTDIVPVPEPVQNDLVKRPIRSPKVPRDLEGAMRYYKVKSGDPIFIRIVKDIRNLELWMQPGGRGDYVLVKEYPVLGMSGKLGPKEKKGDLQAPEGFYRTYKSLLNPNSSYHLSFNVGYPNNWDKLHGRTGSLIMIHGSDVSVGCYAMGDEGVEEIYGLVESYVKSRKGGQGVPIHVYPFVPNTVRLLKEAKNKYFPFWCFLAEAWYWTEENRAPAPVEMRGRMLALENKAELHVDLEGNNTYINKRGLDGNSDDKTGIEKEKTAQNAASRLVTAL